MGAWLANVQTVPPTSLSRLTIWIYGSMALAHCLVISLGGRVRWAGDFYQVIRMVPGSPYSWATWIGVAGLMVLTGSTLANRWRYAMHLRNAGLIAVVTWVGSFAITAAVTASFSPTVGTTAPPTYIAVCLAVVVLLFTDERRTTSAPPNLHA